jgi:hypothetical protein
MEAESPAPAATDDEEQRARQPSRRRKANIAGPSESAGDEGGQEETAASPAAATTEDLGTGQEEHRCRDTNDSNAGQPKGRGEGVEGNLDLVVVAAGESGRGRSARR